MAIEKFKEVRLNGKIKITLDTNRVWEAEKQDIVDAIVDICNEYDDNGDILTLRQLYYQLVSKDLIPNHDTVYKKIGSIKDDIVYSGMVDWDVFEDRGRVPIRAYYERGVKEALEFTKRGYKLDRQTDQPIHIEVWTEKDAISGLLRKVTDPLTMHLVVNKGYSSSTAMYGAYNRFCDQLEEGKQVVILYFGDHDPSGLDMIRDIQERIMFMLLNGTRKDTVWLNRRIERWRDDIMSGDGLPEHLEDDESLWVDDFRECFNWEMAFFRAHFEVRQIGLTMTQIKTYNLPPNPAKITDPRADNYIKQYGKISWEVDALKPDTMRAIVSDAIARLMDKNIYEKVMAKERADIEKLTEMVHSLHGE